MERPRLPQVSAETIFKMRSASGSLFRVMLRLSVAPDSVTQVELLVSVIVNPSASPASVLVLFTVLFYMVAELVSDKLSSETVINTIWELSAKFSSAPVTMTV